MVGIRAPAGKRARPQGARAGSWGLRGDELGKRDIGERRGGGAGAESTTGKTAALGGTGTQSTIRGLGASASGVAGRRGPDQRRGSLAAKKGLTSFL
jgi:hypothetical protein